MPPFTFWQRWLFGLSLVIIAFGLALALFNASPPFDLIHYRVDSVYWGARLVPLEAQAFRGWVYGVLGSTMAGWGVFMAFLARFPFRRRERWAWNCMALGILVWYVPDTLISVNSGVMFNAAFNTLLLVLVGLPLVFTRKEFETRRF